MPAAYCYRCGLSLSSSDPIYHIADTEERDVRPCCITCWEQYHSICFSCDRCIPTPQLIRYPEINSTPYRMIGGDVPLICPDCRNDMLVCDECLETLPHRYIRISSEHATVCRDCCQENCIVECRNCGLTFCSEDETLCNRCNERRIIHDYCYRPPVFNYFGSRNESLFNYFGPNDEPQLASDSLKTIFLGVEIELDGGGESQEKAKQLIDKLGGKDKAYATHDGTLTDGVEIVTHPMTLEYHKESVDWQGFFALAGQLGYTSHDAKTCGLHVHVSRNALGIKRSTQERNIAAIMMLYEKYWEQFVKLSRRTNKQIKRFAFRYLTPMERDTLCPNYLIQKAKTISGKHFAVNILNEETIEFRIFRGTMRYSSFIATLELCEGIVRFVREHTLEQIQSHSWGDIRQWLSGRYNNLSSYFLYIDKRESKDRTECNENCRECQTPCMISRQEVSHPSTMIQTIRVLRNTGSDSPWATEEMESQIESPPRPRGHFERQTIRANPEYEMTGLRGRAFYLDVDTSGELVVYDMHTREHHQQTPSGHAAGNIRNNQATEHDNFPFVSGDDGGPPQLEQDDIWVPAEDDPWIPPDWSTINRRHNRERHGTFEDPER